ncbi:MAG: fumarate hydratase [Gammaproteobacteria bacterium]|nr:MAG: fumarate hydratase [Gammaproteobacteria bacterium]
MTIITEQDFIKSIENALQHIANYHPLDFVQALKRAYDKEQSQPAKDAIAQILENSKMCATDKRPICQDTGIVTVFLKIGVDAKLDTNRDIEELVNDAVRNAYGYEENVLRKSVVDHPATARNNTKDNTPAIVYQQLVQGDTIDVKVAAKGGGSENKAKFVVLNPSDSVVDWVVNTIPTLGAGWCPPGIIGIGIGGTPEKAMLMAKESLLDYIDIEKLEGKQDLDETEQMRLELFEKINQQGIGAQGLGGQTTVLDVKIKQFPTHAASLPVAMIPNCAATRHIHFKLDGAGVVEFPVPDLSQWPTIEESAESANGRPVNVDEISKEDIAAWKVGETLLLSGKILTGRDAAHKRIADIMQLGESLPNGLSFENRFIYYVGPVDPVAGEVVGPAGPTTATRMDKFTEKMLTNTGLIGMIGKAERGPATIESIKNHQAVYLSAVGGAAYLIAKSIVGSRVVAFEDLGMEAVYEFEIKDMPVTVAVDSQGNSIHEIGPKKWKVE